MTRHFNNTKSVQAQLDELKAVQERAKVLISELKDYMETNDLDIVNGETTCYTRTWTDDYFKFNSTQFKKDNPNLFEQYKNQLVAGSYRYEVKAIK
jgi:hypothetical protein